MKRYVATFLRHRRLYLAGLGILLLASAIGTFAYSTTTYEADTRIWIDKPVLSSSLLDPTTQTFGPAPLSPAQEEANKLSQLIQTDSFIASVIAPTSAAGQLTGSPDHDRTVLSRIRGKITVGVAGTNTLTVLFRDKDPALCQQIVQSVIDKYLDWDLQSQLEQSSLQLQFYQKQLDIYDQRVKDAQHALDDFYQKYPNPDPGSPPEYELQRLQRELENAQSLYSTAAAKIAQAGYLDTLTERNQQGKFQIMDKPTVPELPAVTLSTALRFLGIGVAASIGAMLAAVALVTWLDPAIRSAEDLERLGQIPVLGVVPNVKRLGAQLPSNVGPTSGDPETGAAADLLSVERSYLREWAGGDV
jgi:uncharacterized protein involved in exopolysaccharide biosynthesis